MTYFVVREAKHDEVWTNEMERERVLCVHQNMYVAIDMVSKVG